MAKCLWQKSVETAKFIWNLAVATAEFGRNLAVWNWRNEAATFALRAFCLGFDYLKGRHLCAATK